MVKIKDLTLDSKIGHPWSLGADFHVNQAIIIIWNLSEFKAIYKMFIIEHNQIKRHNCLNKKNYS